MFKLVLKQSVWATLALASTAAFGPPGHPPPPPPPPPPPSHSPTPTGGPLPLGPSAFTAPGTFPSSVFSHYFNNPTATSAQPQPVISDPVLHITYPESLTDPNHIPQNDTVDPHPLPPKASSNQLLQAAFQQIISINNSPSFGDDGCTKCLASLEIGKFVALAEPSLIPQLGLMVCEQFQLANPCVNTYSSTTLGPVIAQVLANADVGGYDGQLLCQNFFSACPLPPTSPLDVSKLFKKPKPNPLPPPKKPSGKRLNVMLRVQKRTAPVDYVAVKITIIDTPYSLALAALQSIPVLTNTEKTGFNFTVYTGDLVSHDAEPQLSREYVEYTERVLYDLFKRLLNSGPVYAALGNHDSYNQAQDAPQSLGGELATQFSWNYDHVSKLWDLEGWISDATAEQARAHYAAYSVARGDGLTIITLNTDLWYRANYFNYINLNSSDNSGMLQFLIEELETAEEAGDRVWIIGHVLSGWDGSNPLENPTNLFYQIVDRFSPHVIANIFFGHTHEDQFSIFYNQNGTQQTAANAQTVSWVGPSITPLTNLNSGFRVYEVDSATFDIIDAFTWASNVSTYPGLDHQKTNGPSYFLEYSTREAYGSLVPNWPSEAPLNATWWHHVTEGMLQNPQFVQTFTTFQGKSSVLSAPCTSDECVQAKVCYMRSGSASIAKQNCIQGFGSVQ
ncbi:hypothetical protein Clacol_006890 [Clathrus columnatus]|uniref:Calcineurin-like phosphoesterase domain-containing protein n=1 Tax=Clathrus columnatus TaxID=1419009 RepID=A0AAV5ADD0_9AGAM|nr:hypothetical protein Clacol_006890 [Clathrus columnatus]